MYALCAIRVTAALAIAGGASGSELSLPNPGTPWPATDALGRVLPLAPEVGPPRTDRFVGIFYFTWQSTEVRSGKADGNPYDVSQILAADPDALRKPGSPLWGPIGTYHFWAEPLLGYYANTDPWVVRRHAHWLADAGVDTLIFDATNAQTYRHVYTPLCEMFEQVRRDGGRTPQIAFMVNTAAGPTADTLYRELYLPGKHRDLWFHWQGKPLLLCDPAEARPEWKDFFTLRRAHWPFTLTNTPYAWHWEATFPQPYGYTDDPAKPEQVNVSVAQNLRQEDGRVTNMSDGNARGRNFHDGRMDAAPDAVNWGHNFQEQWQRAFELQPPFVMVTGWNEWIAGRWGKPDGPLVFVDQLDQQFSRDIEPMRGGHGDNYYLQLVANVRRFKGAPALPAASAPVRNKASSPGDWEGVEPVFDDAVGDTAPRDHRGVLALHYADASGRNDIVQCQVARDDGRLYFRVQTREPLTPSTGTNWMWLLLDTDQNRSTGWEGYDFIANRTRDADGAWLERNVGGAWNWEKVLPVRSFTRDGELQLVILRTALGLNRGPGPLTLDFKWADNVQQPGDILDFYVHGDVAPEGRFNYRYVVSGSEAAPSTGRTTAPPAQVMTLDPPEQGFFAKRLDYEGIPIKASAVVVDEALFAAHGRLSMMLSNLPSVRVNLRQAGAELHIIGRDQVTTDLPEWRQDKGKPLAEYHGLTRDQRTRGMGGLLTSCGEENLLRLEKDRYRGRDICVHEFAHNILQHGVAREVRQKVREQHRRSLDRGLWVESYAGSNPHEFFAELAMWYFGTHGDMGMKGPKPESGREGLRAYDSEAFTLLDDVFSGRFEP